MVRFGAIMEVVETADKREDEASMEEILDALQMPRSGLRVWIGDLRRFCEARSKARYRSLIQLVSECEAELQRRFW